MGSKAGTYRKAMIGWSTLACAALTLGMGMTTSCNKHPARFILGGGSIGGKISTSVSDETTMDVLWVVDNSGSMCQEQKALRDNFNAFVDTIQDASLDFHIAVTTTHAPGADANYAQEPVAVEGHIQSEPQPLPGFDNVCLGTFDPASRTYTDLTPIRDALTIAVECMATPNQALLNVTDAQINCALPDSARPGCAAEVGGQDRDGDSVFSIQDIFPLRSEYRQIPKVLRSQDYEDAAGNLDVNKLRSDFACMSLVGTRGYGLEKGLQAAVSAVSPEKTGLVEELPGADASAPNYGFLRKDAAFTLIFVTDENDCSHDGDIIEFGQQCRGAICDYENSSQLSDEQSNLTSITTLASRLRNNLSESKGREVADAEVLIASIHGRWSRYEGPMPDCEVERPSVPVACADPTLGQAFSGDRYDRFMRQFPNYYPNAVTGGDETKRLDFENFQEFGEMCTGDFSASLRAIGEFISNASSGCIRDKVFPCSSDDECPGQLYGSTAGTCVNDLDGVDGFCDTGIVLRLLEGEGSTPIADQAYCLPDSINQMNTDRPSCVVDPALFTWTACPAAAGAIAFEWTQDTPAIVAQKLAGYDLEILYNATIEE